MILVKGRLVWRNKTHEPWNYGARDARALCVFGSLKKNESIIYMRQHASTRPRRFHRKHHQNGLNYPI